MEVIVHPQAVLQIADHATRSKYQSSDIKYICGVIYGIITNKIEISSSTESLLNEVDGSLEVDNLAYKTIDLHHSKNFVDETPIGWYTTQEFSPETIMQMNSAYQSLFDVHLRVQYNQEGNHPITIYLLNKENEESDVQCQETIFEYESELAERVALVQLQADCNADSQISFMKDAYSALDKQLSKICDFLVKVQKGELPFDHDLVRRAATVAKWWKQGHLKTTKDSSIQSAEISHIIGLLGETIVEYEMSTK